MDFRQYAVVAIHSIGLGGSITDEAYLQARVIFRILVSMQLYHDSMVRIIDSTPTLIELK